MATKHKNIEVSAKKPLFGRESEMDKEIAKWTDEGWELTNTTASSRRNYYLLSFEYETDEDEEKSRKPGRGVGCTIALGVIIALALVSNVINSDKPRASNTENTTRVAQVATVTSVVKPTEAPSKSLSTQSAKVTAVKTDIVATSTKIPTRIVPTSTPEPTVVFATVKSGTINARSCASTDCTIVGTVSSGEKVSLIGLQDEWYKVELDDKKSGYVRSDLLVILSDSPNTVITSNTSIATLSISACKPNFMMLGSGFVLANHYNDPADLWSTYSYSIMDNKTYEIEINFGKNWESLGALRVSNFELDRKGNFMTDTTKVNYGFETSIDEGYVALDFDFAYDGRSYIGDIHRFDYDYSSQVRNTTLGILKRFLGAVMC